MFNPIGFVLMITVRLIICGLCLSRIVVPYEVTPFTDQPFASLSYTAVVRGKAALPCHVTTSTPDDSVALILWYKDDALAPIYTLDARKGTLDQARTLIATVLQGRAFFNLHNRPAFLKIDPVRLSDSGEYRCRVDFKKARTINTVISLKVIVPPEEPIITNPDEVNLKGLIGPYNEGDTLKIICTTNGGKPRPSLTWWRDNSLLDDTFEYIDKEVTTNQLTILSLARHHLLSKLTCQAVNNNMTVPLATSITLELNLKPTEVHITQLSPILVASKQVTFECKTIGSRPKPNVYWLFDGKTHSTGISGDQVVTSRITIQVNKSHNGAMLSCIAENPKILNSQISDQLQLDVQYKPEVKLEFGSPTSSSTTIQEGNDVYFDCKIDSNPKPIKSVQWRFNGNQLSPKQGIIVSNQSLVLQKVSRHQSGLYQCIVTNSQGVGTSNEIKLEIRFAPVCLYGFILIYGIALHESAVLRCYVEANPEKVSFQWRFQDKPDLLSNSIQSKGKFSDLIYTVNSSDDYGIVHCTAKNDVGLQRSSCRFLIKPQVPPEFPYNCKIVNQSDDSLFISCIYTGNLNLSNNAQFMGSNGLRSDDALKPITIHPKTIYFAEVYTKNDQNLVINVTSTNAPYYYHDNSNGKRKNNKNENDGDGDNDDGKGEKNDENVELNGSKDGSSTNFLTQSSPELGETGDPFQIIDSLSRPIEFFITSLEPSTVFKINIYAVNSFGRSPSVTLEGSTLRSAEKLIDRSMGSEDGMADYGGNSISHRNGPAERSKSSSSSATSADLSFDDKVDLLRGFPLLLIILIGGVATVCGTVFLGIAAIFRLRRNILNHNGTNGSKEAKNLVNEETKNCTDEGDNENSFCATANCARISGVTSSQPYDGHPQYSQPHQREPNIQIHLFNGNNAQESTEDTRDCNVDFDAEEGPPDIIPSFNYLRRANMDKHSISHDCSENCTPSSIIHYAGLTFPVEELITSKHSPHQVMHTLTGVQFAPTDMNSINLNAAVKNNMNSNITSRYEDQKEGIEYAQGELVKTRVNIIGAGSAKFESSV
uniref:Ig-like domain-containing protein n=1 Tax=Tetranychus urticae TaxID=32264 RepID=T1JRN6_TETUR